MTALRAGGHQVLARDGTVLADGDETQPIVVDVVPVRRSPTDIRALLEAVLSPMRGQAHAADVTMEVTVDAHVPPLVRIDADKIGWAVSALVGNALRYVRHGSPVMPGGSVAVRVSFQDVRPALLIEVQDDGPGIPAEKARHLFDATPGQPRSALGLLIVRDFVVAHAGQIDVRGAAGSAGQGTTIRITLPVESRPAPPSGTRDTI